MRISISGSLAGRRINHPRPANIVHIRQPQAAGGPAENSFILIEADGEPRRARYLSWIGYFDIEYANLRQPGQWILVEPATHYEDQVDWHPYGWERAECVPTIGDSILDEIAELDRDSKASIIRNRRP